MQNYAFNIINKMMLDATVDFGWFVAFSEHNIFRVFIFFFKM